MSDHAIISGVIRRENRLPVYLDLDLTLSPRLVAICPVAPALHKITCASTTRELDIDGDCSLFSDSEIRARLWRRRCSSEGVCFPLRERIISR